MQFFQPRTQASSRYPSYQRRLGTKCDSPRRTFPTSLTGDVISEIAEDDWERGCTFLCVLRLTWPANTARLSRRFFGPVGATGEACIRRLEVKVNLRLPFSAFLLCFPFSFSLFYSLRPIERKSLSKPIKYYSILLFRREPCHIFMFYCYFHGK